MINDYYDIEIKEITKNSESTVGNVYNIKTTNNKYIMKIYDNECHAIAMTKLHTDLYNNNIKVPEILLNKNKEGYTKLNNKYYVIYTFLEGKPLQELEKLDNETIKLIAQELKHLHAVTKNKNYNLKNIPFELNEKYKDYSALHFDLTKSNIFYNELWPNKIGFIDFDDAKYGPSICDVSIIIPLLFISKRNGINKEGIDTFIKEYDSNLNKEEIKELSTKWIKYTISTNNFDTSVKESFNLKEKLMSTFDI